MPTRHVEFIDEMTGWYVDFLKAQSATQDTYFKYSLNQASSS